MEPLILHYNGKKMRKTKKKTDQLNNEKSKTMEYLIAKRKFSFISPDSRFSFVFYPFIL